MLSSILGDVNIFLRQKVDIQRGGAQGDSQGESGEANGAGLSDRITLDGASRGVPGAPGQGAGRVDPVGGGASVNIPGLGVIHSPRPIDR
jgi:hypothetical protein